MQKSPATNPGTSRGFTLLEMLVGMAVLCILIAILSSTLNQASRVWTAGSGDAERRRGARSLADFIGTELGGAQIPVGEISAAGRGNLQFLINPGQGQVPAAYQNADSIFWQAPLATEASLGELAVIGYFVKWDLSNDARPRPLLCRYFINPTIRGNNGSVTRNPDFLVYHETDPQAWLSPSLLEKVAPATADSGYVGLFAENVVGLWVRSYGLDGAELPREFDSRVGYSYTLPYRYTDPSGVSVEKTKVVQRYLPARVNVSLVQIDSHTAERMLPVWETLRNLAADNTIRDASQFIARVQSLSDSQAGLRVILPGLRAHATEVYLENGR